MLFPLSAKASITVGSKSDCISRDRKFDSGLARFNSFAEIDHGIISTAPASIQFWATIGPPAKLDSDGYAGGPIVVHFYVLIRDILLLPLIQKGVSASVTSESITQSTGYPKLIQKKGVDMGTDRLGMRIAVD